MKNSNAKSAETLKNLHQVENVKELRNNRESIVAEMETIYRENSVLNYNIWVNEDHYLIHNYEEEIEENVTKKGFRLAQDGKGLYGVYDMNRMPNIKGTLHQIVNTLIQIIKERISEEKEEREDRKRTYINHSFIYFRTQQFKLLSEIDFEKEVEEYKKYCQMIDMQPSTLYLETGYLLEIYYECMKSPENWAERMNQLMTGKDLTQQVYAQFLIFETPKIEEYEKKYDGVKDYRSQEIDFHNDYVLAVSYVAEKLGITEGLVQSFFTENKFQDAMSARLYHLIEQKEIDRDLFERVK